MPIQLPNDVVAVGYKEIRPYHHEQVFRSESADFTGTGDEFVKAGHGYEYVQTSPHTRHVAGVALARAVDEECQAATAPKKSALDELNTEQRAAIVQFRERFGRTWKSKLMDGWLRAAYPGALQQIRNSLGPEWLAKVKESDFKAGAVNGHKQLPEMCLIFVADAEPGSYVRAVKRGESGSFATTYDVTDPGKAKALVAHMNRKLGIGDVHVECMLAGSMFGWDSQGADPVRMQAIYNERAEALGFSSAEEMFESQRQSEQQKASFARAQAYQETPEAGARRAAASKEFGIPASAIVFVEPPEEDTQQEDEESECSCRP